MGTKRAVRVLFHAITRAFRARLPGVASLSYQLSSPLSSMPKRKLTVAQVRLNYSDLISQWEKGNFETTK